jgi:hypothetical protein
MKRARDGAGSGSEARIPGLRSASKWHGSELLLSRDFLVKLELLHRGLARNTTILSKKIIFPKLILILIFGSLNT